MKLNTEEGTTVVLIAAKRILEKSSVNASDNKNILFTFLQGIIHLPKNFSETLHLSSFSIIK